MDRNDRRTAGILAFYRSGSGTCEDAEIRRLKGEVRRKLAEEERNVTRTETMHEPLFQLTQTLRTLFHTEENLMIRTLYPDYDMQKKLHRYFLGEIHDELEKCGCCSGNDSFCHLIRFMRTWLGQHEFLSDRYFFLHLERWKNDHARIPHGKREPDLRHLNPEYVLLPEKVQPPAHSVVFADDPFFVLK